jgi:hypothetical protein
VVARNGGICAADVHDGFVGERLLKPDGSERKFRPRNVLVARARPLRSLYTFFSVEGLFELWKYMPVRAPGPSCHKQHPEKTWR